MLGTNRLHRSTTAATSTSIRLSSASGLACGDRAQRGESGVVDQDVRDDTERSHLVEQGRAFVAVREIDGQHVCPAVEFFRQVPKAVGPAGHEYQSVTAAGEFAGDLLADS